MSTADDTDNDMIAGLVRDALDGVLDFVEGGEAIGYTVLLHAKRGKIEAVNMVASRDAAGSLDRSRAACAVAIEQIDHTV